MAGPIVEFPNFLQSKQAFHTPSFGDEDFSLESHLNCEKTEEVAHQETATPQVAISCTAQVALLQPYNNRGGNYTAHQATDSYLPDTQVAQSNNTSYTNSGPVHHHQQQHQYQGQYSYPTINRFQHYSPPAGTLPYSNSGNVTTNNSVGSAYLPQGSSIQAGLHQQYYPGTGGYIAGLSSPYGGYNNHPQFPPQHFFDIPDITGDNNSYYYQNYPQNPQHLSQTTHHQQHPHQPHHQQSNGLNSAYIPTTYYNSAMAQRDPILSTMNENRTLGYMAVPDKNSSDDSDDNVPLSKLTRGKVTKRKRGGATAMTRGTDATGKANEGKKPKTPKKRRKKDPNEPVKPVSAYAMFFRDTQSAIKSENPKATFGEVSKIVASMWDGLGDEAKSDYKQRTEVAKKEYLQKLAAYRASLVSQQGTDGMPGSAETSPTVSPERTIMPPVKQVTAVFVPLTQDEPSDHQAAQPSIMDTANGKEDNSSPEHLAESNGVGVSPVHQSSPPPQNQTKEKEVTSEEEVNLIPEEAVTENHDNVQRDQPQEPSAINTNMFYGRDELPSPDSAQCTRSGCGNEPVDSPLWDNEYCSNQCVVEHCRDVFTAWVASRSGYASVN